MHLTIETLDPQQEPVPDRVESRALVPRGACQRGSHQDLRIPAAEPVCHSGSLRLAGVRSWSTAAGSGGGSEEEAAWLHSTGTVLALNTAH